MADKTVTVRGVLEKCYHNRDRNTYSISVNDTWYSTYNTDFTHLEGKMVSFDAVQVKGKYWNVAGKPPVVNVAADQPASAASGGGTMSGGDRERSIVLQSSFRSAGQVLAAMIQAGTTGLPAKATGTDVIKPLLDDLALHIFRRCLTNGAEFVAADDAFDPAPPAGADGFDNANA